MLYLGVVIETEPRSLIEAGNDEQDQEVGVANAAMIAFYLWDYPKANSDLMKEFPIHRTYSIFY